MSSKSKTASKTRSSRAGLIFPVGRVHKMLRKGNYAPRLGGASSVYLTAALEYLAAEVLELAVDVCLEKEKRRVVPRHLLYAIRKDDELNTLLTGVTISQSGVIPHILGQLLPPKTMKHNSSESQSQQF